MPDSLNGNAWELMTPEQKAEVVRQGNATLKQMMEGVLEGPEILRRACSDYLTHIDTSFENIPLGIELQNGCKKHDSYTTEPEHKISPNHRHLKQRFGLPSGFVPRLQRSGRALLEHNIYRLPNGTEVVACIPTETIERLQNSYALLTLAEYQNGERGSLFVRSDGRIFDYSDDVQSPRRELFDTGFTVYELERTGRYVSEPCTDSGAAALAQEKTAT